jgi:hypothetical protein
MSEIFKWFWAVMVFASIAWYFFLLFYVGIKGGREIFRLAQSLRQKGGSHADKNASAP